MSDEWWIGRKSTRIFWNFLKRPPQYKSLKLVIFNRKQPILGSYSGRRLLLPWLWWRGKTAHSIRWFWPTLSLDSEWKRCFLCRFPNLVSCQFELWGRLLSQKTEGQNTLNAWGRSFLWMNDISCKTRLSPSHRNHKSKWFCQTPNASAK